MSSRDPYAEDGSHHDIVGHDYGHNNSPGQPPTRSTPYHFVFSSAPPTPEAHSGLPQKETTEKSDHDDDHHHDIADYDLRDIEAHDGLLQERNIEEHPDQDDQGALPARHEDSIKSALQEQKAWAQRARDATKHAPAASITGTYQLSNIWIMLQLLLAFGVLGSAATIINISEDPLTLNPYAAIPLAVAVLTILAAFPRLRIHSVSPTTAKPSMAYTLASAAIFVLWAAAMGCAAPMVVTTFPYRNELTQEKYYTGCGKYSSGPCHHETTRSKKFNGAMICLCFTIVCFLANIGQLYQLSKFWRLTVAEDDMRREYEAETKHGTFKDAFWRGVKEGKAKANARW